MQILSALPTSACFTSLRLVAYPSGSAMAPHSHEVDHVGLPVAGRYLERIRGRETEHRLGDILYYPAGEVHSQYFAPGGMTKLLLAPSEATRAYLADHLRLAEAPHERAELLVPVALRLVRELRAPDPHSGLIADGLAFEIMGQFARASAIAAQPARWLAAARDYVRAHACGPLSIGAVARHVDRDPGELARSYRRQFGRGIGEDARVLRLSAAAALLSQGREPLAEIAVRCGFFDQAHFTRCFKAAYGMTPGAWRKAAN